MDFRDFWRIQNGYTFAKSRLTKSEIIAVQELIERMQKEGHPSSKIIDALQKLNPQKLGPRWKSERAFWTQVKKDDTEAVADVGEEVGFTRYQVLLSPHACHICREKSDNGKKIYSTADVEKAGWGHVPPYHPSCFCVVIPYD